VRVLGGSCEPAVGRQGNRVAGSGQQADSGVDDRAPSRRRPPTRTAIVAAVLVGVTGVAGATVAHAGHLVPSEQNGPGGGGPGGGAPAGGGFGERGTGGTGTTGTTRTAGTNTTTAFLTSTRVTVDSVGGSRGAAAVDVVGTTGYGHARPAPPGGGRQLQPATPAEVTGKRQETSAEEDTEL
jgi:hypothetical protein